MRKAAGTAVPDACDVCVVGGGAAGIVAAIASAEAGATTVVLEAAPEAGRTILATGNGRCNFCNADLDPARYNDPAFVGAVMGADPLHDVLGLFADSGLIWTVEDGRYYPRSLCATSVRDVLLARAEAAGVVMACARPVGRVSHDAGGMCVGYEGSFSPGTSHVLHAATVIVATGGTSVPQGLEGSVVPRSPVLCSLSCTTPMVDLARLDGRRVRGEARLLRAGTPIYHESGEVLLRTYGISGIVTFDLSRRASAGDVIELDLVPELDDTSLAAHVRAHGSLDGALDPMVASELARHTHDPAELAHAAKHLTLLVDGPADAEHAQVTRGGLATRCFSASTLASHEEPTLFACGEALDVDADCGGFNLAWAWTSGMVAGRSAAATALSPSHTPAPTEGPSL
ncbi:MAG: NAD(P)/FAD-dependent oxidoreductase [Atopobiaceae bacterium]|jgi:predicted Rossmann fold flavoprotein|nr:NAD(P)/FAD-dependent oxidoreductase [Atopobiaceae bacterium]MCH4276681.1 NAD(P)/FAD-dependent oxidoreductase [Atopobiaceae bacterium]MCI1259888.1 NAD(P)/FAD-dependent oxidoreductase [Atopobiaceae bacterium]MDD3176953.1 aminoacetone oxidase family FAD-binding enzyme [Atopobiaceae bacterium]MDD3485819.1 aminoacetone oxidase family FAD-binding enzyme [Atopobiaceae bacterium]